MTERGDLALTRDERSLTINVTDQPCSVFALHEKLALLKELCDCGDLTFFANTGVIGNLGMTKSNFEDLTQV